MKDTPLTKSIANISGPNGIPDGYNGKAVVEELDLCVIAEQWLMGPNTISKATTLPYNNEKQFAKVTKRILSINRKLSNRNEIVET